MRAEFVWREGHTLSCSDRSSKRAALYTHPSPQEGVKRTCLDPYAPGRHSQPYGDSGRHSQKYGYPDAHFSPQEGASSDDNPCQLGGSYQIDAHFSQQEGASK